MKEIKEPKCLYSTYDTKTINTYSKQLGLKNVYCFLLEYINGDREYVLLNKKKDKLLGTSIDYVGMSSVVDKLAIIRRFK
jgi:hypothetical protein